MLLLVLVVLLQQYCKVCWHPSMLYVGCEDSPLHVQVRQLVG
jgi:hypothetical protein